ncbi:MAG: SurA N-terminal domain-containing protein [Verrucomicrobia bacterium]|nr:SurA N-terminal domain-containing protein [Verrucomicrobiota bacterium]
MPMLIGKFHKLIQSKLLWGLFLGIVVIAFVGLYMVDYLVPSADERSVISAGTLDGEDVSHQEFRHAYVNSYLSLALAVGRAFNVNDKIEAQLREAAWKRVAALKKVAQMNLSASDTEVVAAIKNHPGFSDQGQFNKAIYGAFVARVLKPMGISERGFEEYIREEIGINKLRQMLQQSLLVSPYEMKRTFNSISDSFQIEYVAITEEDVVDKVEVTEEDARTYFEDNRDDFMLPEKVRVEYVRFPVASHMSDIEVMEDDMLAYYEQNILDFAIDTNAVDEGTDAVSEDSAEEAAEVVDVPQETSSDESVVETAGEEEAADAAESVNDTNDMPEAFVDMAFMSDNEASAETEDDETTKPFDEVRDEIESILRRKAALYRTADYATDFVVKLAPDRDGNAPDFETAATDFGLEVMSLPPFASGDELEGIESPAAFERAAFSRELLPDEYFSDAILGDDYVYVLALKERIKPQIPEYEEVADKVKEAASIDMTVVRLKEQAEAVGEGARAALQEGKTLEDVARKFDLEITKPAEFTAASGIEENPYSDYIVRTVLFLNENEISDPIPTEDCLLIVHVAKRTPGDPTAFATIRDQLVGSIIRERSSTLFQDWQSYLLKEGGFEEKLQPEPEEEL